MKNKIEIGFVSAKFNWMLHEHHGWAKLHRDFCCTREEWNKSCDEVIMKAAGDSSDQPSLFERDEFLTCDYYESQFASIKTDTTHILTDGHSRTIEQFTNEADANKAYDEAMRDHGLARLTCDQGGHAGPTERVDVEDVEVTVYVRGEQYKFEADSDEANFDGAEIFKLMSGEDLEDESEIAQMKADAVIVADLVNAAIYKLQDV